MTTQSIVSRVLLAALAAASIGAALYEPGRELAKLEPSAAGEPAPPWLTQEGQEALQAAGVGGQAAAHGGHSGQDPHAGLGIAPAYPDHTGALAESGHSTVVQGAAWNSGAHGGNPHGHAQWTTALPTEHRVACERSAAKNGHTVGELHQRRRELGDTTVVVRATVTKVTKGIRGANYVHLRDGSGSAEAGTHDLTVETQQAPEVGQVVEWKGQLTLDQDLGWGYHYAVLLRGAERVGGPQSTAVVMPRRM